MHILTDIPAEITLAPVLRRIHMSPEDPDTAAVERLIDWARSVARPKALYDIAFVGGKTHDSVEIGGITFTSRVLRVNVDQVHRVFPFIVTCGAELDAMPSVTGDPMEWFWGDEIKHHVLALASDFMHRHIEQTYAPGELSAMSPGSLPDWPISQQPLLFSLLGEPHASIGVSLTETFLMVPMKSVSGILFSSDAGFRSCQLCPRDGCPGRQAEYDPENWQAYR